MAQKLEYTVLDLIESATRNSRVQPLNLGGFGGAGGGVGAPPGGYIGRLPQYQVVYDTTEAATLNTMPSGETGASGWSLVDNLNHIRYRLNILESGGSIVVWDDNDVIEYPDTSIIHFSGAGVTIVDLGGGEVQVLITAVGSGGAAITVQEADGSPIVNNVDKIIFSGASVTDLGNGDVLVTISGGGGGDSTYLRLDATNDPVTGPLVVDVNDVSTASKLSAVEVYVDDSINEGLALYAESAEGSFGAAWLVSYNGYTLALSKFLQNSYVDDYPTVGITRTPTDNSLSVFNSSAYRVYDSKTVSNTAIFSGGTLQHVHYSGAGSDLIIADINPYTIPGGSMVLFDSIYSISNSGRLLSLRNQTVEKFYVTGSGLVNIPTGQTYNIGGSPHKHTQLLSFGPFSIIESPYTTHGHYPYICTIGQAITLTRWIQSVYIVTTNNGSNYWTIRLADAPGNQIAAMTTAALSANAWTQLSTTSFDKASLATSDLIVTVQILKTGSPGGLYIATPWVEFTLT